MPGTNDFLSKPLVALKQGKNCGIITNVLFDEKLQKAQNLLLYDRLDGAYYTVPMEKAQKTQGDAVMIDDAADVAPFEGEIVFNPVNFDVFDANGAHLGVINEVLFAKDLQVKYMICRDRRITPDKVLSYSNGTMVIKAAPKQRPVQKTPQPAPQKPPVRQNIGAGSFMLGRRCDKTLLNRFNEVIIRQNGVITADVIRQAKLNGKLLELSMHAVTDK